MTRALLVAIAISAGCTHTLVGPDYALHADCSLRDVRVQGWGIGAMCGYREGMDQALELDADTDPAGAAGIVAICAAPGSQCDPAAPHYLPVILAQAAIFAERIEPGVAAAAFAKTGAPAWMVDAFPRRYTAARQRVRELVAARGPHFRAALIDPVIAAREAYASATEALASWRPKIEALAARADAADAPTPVLLDEALALRRAYVAACAKVRPDAMHCLGDALGFQLVQLVGRLAIIDPPLAEAERTLSLRDYRSVAVAEREAYDAAMTAEEQQAKARRRAVDGGMGQAALAKRWPDPLVVPNPYRRLGQEAKQLSTVIRGGKGATREVHEVRAVRRDGAMATIDFARQIDENEVGYGCYETNKVVAIEQGGKLDYESRCAGYKHESHDVTPKSVTVPAAEVAHVQAKEWAVVWIDPKTRRGHVAEVQRKAGGDRVQDREWRRSGVVLSAAP